MKAQIFDYNTIEKYIDGLLDEANTRVIEARMQSDKEFAKEIALWRSILHSIPNEEATSKVRHFHQSLKQQGVLEKIHHDLSSKTPKPIFWKSTRFITIGLTSIAASLVGLIFLWNFNTPTDFQAVPFTDLLSPEIVFSVRAENAAINQLEKQALGTLNQGMVAYNNQDYSSAISNFNQFLKSIKQDCCRPITNQYYDIRVKLYLGHALLKTGKAKVALTHFKAVSNSKILHQQEETRYLEGAKWYTALAYLELFQKSAAISILQELQSSTFYQQESQLLLLELK